MFSHPNKKRGTAFLAGVTAMLCVSLAAAQGFVIRDLGSNNPKETSVAVAVSDRGEAIGHVTLAGITTSRWYTEPKPVVIPALGGANVRVYGINSMNQIVGEAETDYAIPPVVLAFMTVNGQTYTLPNPNGEMFSSGARDINFNGSIVGWVELPDSVRRAVIWDIGPRIETESISFQTFILPSFGGPNSVANAVSETGMVVGVADTDIYDPGFGYVQQAFVWNQGDFLLLPTLGGVNAAALDVNADGLVVGWSEVGETYETHATMWRNGKAVDLGTLTPGTPSYALGINNHGDVVGYSFVFVEGRLSPAAFLYRDGVMTTLDVVIGGQRSNKGKAGGKGTWNFLEARGINDRGDIVGMGLLGDQVHAFMISPWRVETD